MAAAAALCISPRSLIDHFSAEPAVTLPLGIGIGIATCILPYLLYTLAMRDLSAGTASALGIFEPMAASLYSFLLLGEQPNLYSFLGIGLILIAVVLLGKAEDSASSETEAGK